MDCGRHSQGVRRFDLASGQTEPGLKSVIASYESTGDRFLGNDRRHYDGHSNIEHEQPALKMLPNRDLLSPQEPVDKKRAGIRSFSSTATRPRAKTLSAVEVKRGELPSKGLDT